MHPRNAMIGGLLLAAGLPGLTARAQLQTIEPIAIRPAKDNPLCQLYLKSDGSRLMFKGQPVAAGGICPPEFRQGNVVRFGANTYRLQIPGEKADCIITPQGLGRCR